MTKNEMLSLCKKACNELDDCENCPNNPTNNPHSSGFCNCALASLMNPIY